MINVVKELKTKYLAAHYVRDLYSIFEKDKEIDLGGARVCRDCMKVVLGAIEDGANVYDSVDKKQDAYLKDAYARRELRVKLAQTSKPLYLPQYLDKTIEYIKKLEVGSVYEVSTDKELNIPYIVMIQALRPEIQINPSIIMSKLFAFIRTYLFPCKKRWGEFYRMSGNTFVVEKPDADYETYIRDNTVIPTAFGKDVLMGLEEWQPVIEAATEAYEYNFQHKFHRIKDYL